MEQVIKQLEADLIEVSRVKWWFRLLHVRMFFLALQLTVYSPHYQIRRTSFEKDIGYKWRWSSCLWGVDVGLRVTDGESINWQFADRNIKHYLIELPDMLSYRST